MASSLGPSSISDVIADVSEKVALIKIQDSKSNTFSYGSGILLEKGLIFTCSHILGDYQSNHNISVTFKKKKPFHGILQYFNSSWDLAAIKVTDLNLMPARMGSTVNIKPSDKIFSIGYPRQLETVTDGIVSSELQKCRTLDEEMYFLRTNSVISNGSSGGPVIDEQGQILGINAYSLEAGFTFAIPIDFIKDFMKTADLSQKEGKLLVEHCRFKRFTGLCLVKIPKDLMLEKSGDEKTYVLEVTSVANGSPAYKAGLKPRDIIISINNRDVQWIWQFNDAMKDERDRIKFYRDGEIKRVILP